MMDVSDVVASTSSGISMVHIVLVGLPLPGKSLPDKSLLLFFCCLSFPS